MSVAHLHPKAWERVTRIHVAKMLGEFAHERLVTPQLRAAAVGGKGPYLVGADEPGVHYRFTAQIWALEHWEVEPDSIVRLENGTPMPLDSLGVILDLREQLGLSEPMIASYLEEMSAGLYADAYKLANQCFDAAALARASFQAIETSMTAGHPCFAANAGRLGFDIADHRRYSPEAARPLRLVWLAASRARAQYRAIEGLDYERLVDEELGAATRLRFEQALRARGLDPDRYLLFPVHPWQWRNRLCTTLAGELGREDLVYLGEGEDLYQPQQSIRTLFNVSVPVRRYVKTALDIVNMGFVRGLSPYYMEGTPAINQWVDELVRGDPTLRRCGFAILREVATVGYRIPTFERAAPRTSPHNKMLAALWRDSPWTKVGEHHRLMTMAALLHVDADGTALLRSLIEQSGATPERWIGAYLHAYLTPLLHCFYAHRMVFMPHGENIILVLEDGLPTRAFMKDIAEEVALLGCGDHLPPVAQRIAMDVPEQLHLLSIFTDVFDCFFRFLAPIAARHCGLPERAFWGLVARTVRDYQREHPQLAGLFERYDLFAPSFLRSCLNRLQLCNARQLVDLADPAGALQIEGELANPLANFAQEST